MKRYLSIIAILFCSISCFAKAPLNDYWIKANAYYQQKQYDSAVNYYEQIAAMKPHEAKVYYNLGNAYYKSNKIGSAVLNFERALRIQPSFKEAEDNLMLTQNRIPNRIQSVKDIFFVRGWQSLTNRSKANTWAIASLLIFLVLLASIGVKRFRRPAWLLPQVIGGIGAVFLLSMVIAVQSAVNAKSREAAIVMQNDAPLMSSSQQTKIQSLIPEGTKVEITSIKAGWLEVRLPDGRTGWLLETQLSRI